MTPHQQERIKRLDLQVVASSCSEGTIRCDHHERPIVLIACSKAKVPTGCVTPARDLYAGELFRKSRAYAEAINADWYILSAKHRVISPDHLLGDYNHPMADLGASERRFWSRGVAWQLRELSERKLIVLAGQAYCGWTDGFIVERPLKGYGIGWQLCKLNMMLKEVA